MNRDFERFPNDDNGNLLWQMVEEGNDLTEPYEVEFSIVFVRQEQAEACALALLRQEQKISMFQEELHSDGSDLWVLNIHVNMILEHEDIRDLEEWITRIAEESGGEYDGWGCMSYIYDEEE